jgi:hypothetical protein
MTVTRPAGTLANWNDPSFSVAIWRVVPSIFTSALRTYSPVVGLKTRPAIVPVVALCAASDAPNTNPTRANAWRAARPLLVFAGVFMGKPCAINGTPQHAGPCEHLPWPSRPGYRPPAREQVYSGRKEPSAPQGHDRTR